MAFANCESPSAAAGSVFTSSTVATTSSGFSSGTSFIAIDVGIFEACASMLLFVRMSASERPHLSP